MAVTSLEFAFVRDLMRERAGVVLEPGKEYLIESRLASVARSEGFASLQELISRLRSRPTDQLRLRVVEAMVTNETSFFRDLHPFEALRTTVIPELKRRRAADRRLVVWSAAASTGQEPYSIAMILADLGLREAGWTVDVLATDLSTEVLARAATGVFTQLEVNRGLPASLLVKYFTKEGGATWRIASAVRDMVQFSALNLAGPWPSLRVPDIVFMRNVLIYFETETKRDILGRVRRLMRPDGYLFLGGAETTLNLDDGYDREPIGKTACYRPRPKGEAGHPAMRAPGTG